MKKLKLVLIAFFVSFFVSAQSPCKVLLAGLDSVYVGECKKGLANGSGEAWGKFYYKGKFVSGYPQGLGMAEYPDGTVYDGSWRKGLRNGRGTVTFEENGQTVEKTWIWVNDTQQKEVLPPAYKVITKRNITRLNVISQGGPEGVWFQPMSDGGVSSDSQDFMLYGSSGSEVKNNPMIGYENVRFPFTGSIRYKTWNKLRTMEYELFLEIEITQPGNWVVQIQN